MNHHKRTVAAIIPMAAIAIGLLASGCCTKRDVAAINQRLSAIEAANADARARITRMDSVLNATIEADRELKNDVRTSNQELIQQMTQLLANYNDLMARIDMLASKQVIKAPLKSSPGAQDVTPPAPQDTAGAPPPVAAVNPDCVDAYDNAFTQVRRGEYDTAIVGFQKFITDCPTNNDVENAHYWIGECYYSQEKYNQAISEYNFLITNYPNSPNVGRALYKLARCKQEIGKKDEAKILYERLVKEFAGTLEAEQATQRLKDLK